MKVAIYIEEGITQLVLTPHSAWEQSVCDKLAADGQKRVQIRRGSFYETRGGWMRFSEYENADDKSLILRIEDDEPVAMSVPETTKALFEPVADVPRETTPVHGD